MKSWAHFLSGSITVYLLMAACSAGSRHSTWGQDNTAAGGKGGMSSPATSSNATGGDVIANAGTSAPNGSSGDEGTTGATGGTIGGMVGDMMDPVPDADAAPTVSGSRLKAKYIAGEDGSRQFNYVWHDTKRNEDCNFTRVAGGGLRCIPSGYASQVYFADDVCSVPLWMRVKAVGCAQQTNVAYGISTDASGCVSSVQTLAAAHPSKVYVSSSDQCIGTEAPDAYEYFSATGASVALAEFVAGTEEVE